MKVRRRMEEPVLITITNIVDSSPGTPIHTRQQLAPINNTKSVQQSNNNNNKPSSTQQKKCIEV
jgi:hypothetical protein